MDRPLTVNSVWIGMSSSVILFNKWILDTLHFRKGPYSSHSNGEKKY